MKNRFFSSDLYTLAMALFLMAISFQNPLNPGDGAFRILLLGIAIYLAYRLFLTPRKVVLFDFGGVVAEGDYYTEPLKIRNGIPALVNMLKRKNYEVALLTNQNAMVQECIDRKFNLPRLFSTRIVSGKVGYKKPDPRIYKKALSIMGSKPENTYFIDDRQENVEGAKKAGLKAIQFRSVQQVSHAIQ